MFRAIVYARGSTKEQADEGTSLYTKVDRGLAKAQELRWSVPDDHIIREDWTGKDLDRPGIQRILDLASSGA